MAARPCQVGWTPCRTQKHGLAAYSSGMWSHLPKLVRFILMHAVIGMSLGVGATALIVWRDLFGLGSLLAGSPLAMTIFGFQMALTLGAIQIGVAVMSKDWDED